tara:strand:+ start:612 stop:845 length:234 start_codon:yes stop_codon:yes gene_type:complete
MLYLLIINLQKTKQMRTLPKYKQNLKIQGNNVWSYTTIVAKIDGCDLHQLGYWSMTTQKHINYVANYMNLNLIKNES